MIGIENDAIALPPSRAKRTPRIPPTRSHPKLIHNQVKATTKTKTHD
ncbi:hypothetical protein [Anabaena sp. CCY 9910]